MPLKPTSKWKQSLNRRLRGDNGNSNSSNNTITKPREFSLLNKKDSIPLQVEQNATDPSPPKRTRNSYKASGTVPVVKIKYGAGVEDTSITEEPVPQPPSPPLAPPTAAVAAPEPEPDLNVTQKDAHPTQSKPKSKKKRFFDAFDPDEKATKKQRTTAAKKKKNAAGLGGDGMISEFGVGVGGIMANDGIQDENILNKQLNDHQVNDGDSSKPTIVETIQKVPTPSQPPPPPPPPPPAAATTTTTTSVQSQATNNSTTKSRVKISLHSMPPIIEEEPNLEMETTTIITELKSKEYSKTIKLSCGVHQTEVSIESLIARVQEAISQVCDGDGREGKDGGLAVLELRKLRVLDSLFGP
ncbi:hypothetical protein BDR26DRAFT_858455 [Obelidium mucronatum]|nr:hypothetical protein BDR26DRAFT_858455 [Obelidium mucronatum]